ncbi:MAG: phosphoribosylglycinamide formyltransferase [Paludibacter sp.]|nr:phosphoribosylglycinamide formyltransferase [Paludibacter sp.]
MPIRIAIFASGSGSNAENIIKYFSQSDTLFFPLIISNKPDAYVHRRAENLKIPSLTFTREEFSEGSQVIQSLKLYKIDCIVLAGFLLKIPACVVKAFPDKIINIHPALLPKYGGKGMYGDKVHQAVVDAHDKETGITIHYVNENYDEGNIIFQAKCSVLPTDTPEMVALKVHALEYEYYPKIIEKIWG